MNPTPSWRRADLVPLEQRVRFLLVVRVASVLFALALPVLLGDRRVDTTLLAVGGGGLLVGMLLGVAVRRARTRGRWLFGLLLLVDGLLLAALVHGTGGLDSPARHLVVLHLVVVTLVASHRTGLKLAIWHSLLLLTVHEAVEIGWLGGQVAPEQGPALPTYLALLWAVTLVTATSSAVNEREILRRRYDLEALARMSDRLERTHDLHTVAEIVVDAVVDTFGGRRAAVISIRMDEPMPLAGHDLAPVAGSASVTGVLAQVRDTRSTALVSGLGEADAWLAAQLPDARNLVLVPLVVDDVVQDVLVLELSDRVGHQLERRVVATLERFSSQGALALRTARLHAELVAMSQTDGLTGVANRSAFDRAIQAELSRAERTGAPCTLLLCDLDDFKAINDTHGHVVGDQVLVAVARTLAAASRPYDVVARYGGEEFAVLLPGTSLEDARAVAERIRRSIAMGPTSVPVTVSIGAASVGHGTSATDAIRAADMALYNAKHDGRNRVHVSRPVQPGDEQRGGG